MKKILSLLALSCLGMGAWADVVQPSAGKLFKMHCAATSGHTSHPWIQISTAGNINHEAYYGSYFEFEPSDTDGQWYIKDAGSGKYLVVASTANNTPITLSDDPTTYWTTTTQGDGIRFLANGTNGAYINNNGALAVRGGTGGCSSWVLQEMDDVAKGTSLEAGWYKIEVGDGNGANHPAHKGKYLTGQVTVYNNNNWGISFSQAPETDLSALIYVNKNGDDYTFTFNKGTRNEYTIGQNSIVNTTAGNFTLPAQRDAADNFQFAIRGGSNRIVAYTLGGKDFVGNTTSAGNNNANDKCYYVFHKAEAPAATEVTYTYKCEGVEDVVITKTQAFGSAFEYEVPVFGEVTSVEGSGAVSSTNNTCVINYTSTLPFTPGLVYRLKVRNSDNGKAVAYANNKPVTNSATGGAFALENLWVIERVDGTVNDYKLYNLGAGQYVNGNGFSATGKAYTIGQFAGREGAFNLVVSGTTNNSLGDHANANTQLGEWNGGSNKNDAGSCFWVEGIAADINTLTKIGNPDSHFLGECEISVNAEAKAVAAATPNVANVKALFAYAIDPSKYYRLSSYDTGRSGGKWLSSNAAAYVNGGIIPDGRRKLCSNDAEGGVGALFQFEESDGAYYVTHINSGSSICNLTNNNAAMDFPVNKVAAGTFTLTQVAGKWWGIKTKNANEYLHQSNWGGINQVLLWNGAIESTTASHWSIEEVEALPLTIKESKWASVCYPVAVTLPETLTAYYAQSASTEGIMLKELEGNVVPANTPVLLTGEAGDYNLTIGGTAAAVEGNRFTGTTLPREGFEEATGFRYGLSNGEFKKISGNVIAANKAFYACDDNLTPAASALRIYVGEDELTGIDSVEATSQGGAYYDLNGRMVAYPTNGVYVHNGKKVFIK